MPLVPRRPPQYKPQKKVEIELKDFSGGWNNIFRPTELKDNELAQADNLMLTGRGVPTGRWGSRNHYLAGSGNVRLITSYRATDGTKTLLSLTDMGYLSKKSGASYTVITGASFASGATAEAEQLGGYTYIVQGSKNLVRFDGSDLDVYTGISSPAGVTATNFSGASGSSIFSWRVSAMSNTGETLGSTAVSLSNLPLDLTTTQVNVAWNGVSAASGVLTGYSVYRGLPGGETFIASVGPSTTIYYDVGVPASDIILPPTSDTTAGPKGKYILKFDDRLVISGIEGDPTLVLISGRYPYHDRFNWADGGGYIRINPDGGDQITGLGVSGSQTQGGTTPASILVLMDNSVHQVVLKTVSIGNFAVLDPQSQLLAPSGCSASKTVVPIENNTLYFGRLGLFVIGSEAAYLNQIRTREISARIREYVRNLSSSDYTNATAGFIDYKYLLSFPNRKETVVYDWERACFMGPWKTPYGITAWYDFVDTDGSDYRLAGADDGYVKQFSESLTSDSGSPIVKLLRTKKIDFKNWSVMKVVQSLYVLFRNVKGTVQVNIRLEERTGQTVTSKSFNITGSLGTAGWGTDQWGTTRWGTSGGTVSLTGEEIIRWAQLYKTARVLQVEVTSTGSTDNWEFLGTRSNATYLEEGSLSSTTRV